MINPFEIGDNPCADVHLKTPDYPETFFDEQDAT
jgi:hypothetical protein